MKEKLTEIIIKAVGEDKNDVTFDGYCEGVQMGYNQAIDDIRAKAPMIAEQVLGEIYKDLHKTELAYQRGSERVNLTVYCKEPSAVENAINYNSRVLAEKNAEAKLQELISKKVYNFINSLK